MQELTARTIELHAFLEVVSAQKTLDAWMIEQGYPQVDRFAMILSLQEAVSNAVRHGHNGDETKVVRVSLLVKSDETVIVVEDQGSGFDPRKVPNPLHVEHLERNRKWGLSVMRSYTSWMTFNNRGNRVSFGRRRSK